MNIALEKTWYCALAGVRLWPHSQTKLFILLDNSFLAFVSTHRPCYVPVVLRLFRCVRKICEKRLLASSCLSVRPHGTTRLPLDGFSWNLVFEYFSKIRR
jgi:hypothetical protein